jgi:hypothetical protein
MAKTDDKTPADRPAAGSTAAPAPADPLLAFKDSADVVAFLRDIQTRVEALEGGLAAASDHLDEQARAIAGHGSDISDIHALFGQLRDRLAPAATAPAERPQARPARTLASLAAAATPAEGTSAGLNAEGQPDELVIDPQALGPGTHLLPPNKLSGGLPIEVHVKRVEPGQHGIGGLAGRRTPGTATIRGPGKRAG